MSGLGLEGGAGEVESVSIAERLKLTDNIHVMDVPGGGYILLCGIYGEIEGHDKLPAGMKSTSYEKLLPVIDQAENCGDVKGVLTLINTVGGDVESGLAISEKYSHRFPGPGWRTFHRSSSGGVGKCVFYSADRNDDSSSIKDKYGGAWS